MNSNSAEQRYFTNNFANHEMLSTFLNPKNISRSTKTRYLSRKWARKIQSPPSPHIFQIFWIILSSRLCVTRCNFLTFCLALGDVFAFVQLARRKTTLSRLSATACSRQSQVPPICGGCLFHRQPEDGSRCGESANPVELLSHCT